MDALYVFWIVVVVVSSVALLFAFRHNQYWWSVTEGQLLSNNNSRWRWLFILSVLMTLDCYFAGPGRPVLDTQVIEPIKKQLSARVANSRFVANKEKLIDLLVGESLRSTTSSLVLDVEISPWDEKSQTGEVKLTWTPMGDSYQLYRNDKILEENEKVQKNVYEDKGLEPGDYTYHVIVDRSDSNVVTSTITEPRRYHSWWHWKIMIALWIMTIIYLPIAFREEAVEAWQAAIQSIRSRTVSGSAVAGRKEAPPSAPSAGKPSSIAGGWTFMKELKAEVIVEFLKYFLVKMLRMK